MIRIGIVGIGFMGMKHIWILRSVMKPRDFREISTAAHYSLCS
jgi:hypothetical protein